MDFSEVLKWYRKGYTIRFIDPETPDVIRTIRPESVDYLLPMSVIINSEWNVEWKDSYAKKPCGKLD